MKKCKLKGEFDYIKYDDSTKLEILNTLTSRHYTRLEMQGHADWLLFAKFNAATKEFESDIEIMLPGEYLVLLDDDRIGHYDEATFNSMFFDKEKGEEVNESQEV